MATPGSAGPPRAVLGARVRAARMRRGMSMRALARALDVSPATLSQIENGRTGLSAQRLHDVAAALDMTIAEVLDDSTDPAGPRPWEPQHAARPRTTGAAKPAAPDLTAIPEGEIPNWREYAPLDFDPVLRGALQEILDIGYHGATVRSIAGRCGFSVAGIYHYYTSKQQMLTTILERTMTELLMRARAARAEGSDPVERFSLLIEHLALFHTQRAELGFLGASEMRSLDPASRRRIAEMRTAQQRMVDDEVEAGVRLGRFRNDHPHDAARAAVTMCTALSQWWRPGGPLRPEEVAERYVGFALALLR